MSASSSSVLSQSGIRGRNGGSLLRDRCLALLPGLVLAGTIAFAGVELGKIAWLQSHGISALTIAILLGMVTGNTVYARLAPRSAPGVVFAKQNLLRLGIILYGLRLTFQDIGHVGVAGIVSDALVLCSTFSLACWLGARLFGLERETAMLIGAGSSICGAAAVMAAEPVVRGRPEQVTVAVSTVVVFGTVAIFLYPALYHLNSQYQLLRMSPTAYGLFAGSTIHEVAQVVAAGRAIGEQAANTAVIAKMVRVMMLAPFLIILSAYISRSKRGAHAHSLQGSSKAAPMPGRIVVPWFALGFVLMAGFNSLGVLPKTVAGTMIDIDTAMLAMAMAGLGLTTHVAAIRTAGIKPLLLGAVLFFWLMGGGLLINTLVAAVFS
jgi:uncharacterized integral membrane protein (TIGR00698 family)